MRQINPFAAAVNREGSPEDKAARSRRELARTRDCIADVKKYRLHYDQTPVGMVVAAHPMEVHSWNKNARAYYAHQITLGRELLPLLEWKEVGMASGSLVWRVVYRENGKEKQLFVSANSKSAAKREAEQMLSVAAVIKSCDQDEDVEGAIQSARAINGDNEEVCES